MKLKITHLTQYTYENAAIDSVNELRLTPVSDEHQLCREHSIMIDPAVSLFSSKDYFGNTTHFFTLNTLHQQLEIKMEAIVETHDCEQRTGSRRLFNEEYAVLSSDPFQNMYAEYLMETDYTALTPELITFAKTMIDARQAKNTYQLLEQISECLYTHFTYDQSATNVHTTLEETLRLKRGVCQDYAHLMIGICRIFEIPCRYVSGYQYIGDPENNQSNVQHASHAWVEAYIPFTGWVGFDPTNNGKVNWRYVKISHGRDYRDIAPVKGVYQGFGRQNLTVSVDVQYIGN